MPLSNRRNKRMKSIIGMLLAGMLVLTSSGCAGGAAGEERTPGSGTASSAAADESGSSSRFQLTRADQETEEPDSVRTVDLSREESPYVITDGGAYELSGSFDGQVVIEAEEQVVHLFLRSAEVRASAGPAICARSAGKVIITSLPGTENALSDSGDYRDAEQGENACLYAACDVTLNGEGSLSVNGYYKDGIHSKDVVKVLGCAADIVAKRDGIRGNDGIYLDGTVSVESEEDGIHTTKTKASAGGTIEVQGGTLTVIAGGYAMQAAGPLTIAEDAETNLKGVLGDVEDGGISVETGE